MRRITALPLAALTLTSLAACTTGSAATSAPASHSTGPVAQSAPSTPATTPSATQTPTHTAGPTTTPTPTAAPTSSAPAVHFDTPEAAMRYLAAAYNRNDLAALKKVTNPDARNALESMRAEAVNLKLESCDRQPAGDYLCVFSHDYPPGYSPDTSHDNDEYYDGHGHATFVVAPADNPGWYMTVLLDCG